VQTADQHEGGSLFTTVCDSCNGTMAKPTALAEAEQRFKAGLVHEQPGRDGALALLPLFGRWRSP
jgi:hypothetical protein